MNEYAQRLGMRSTHYDDVDGLPEPQTLHHRPRPGDAAVALIRDFPQYYYIFRHEDFTWNHIKQRNRDSLLWTDPSVDGLKTGHTDAAGYCLIASAQRKGMRLVSVVLHAPKWNSRESDSEALLNYGFNFFETEQVATAQRARFSSPASTSPRRAMPPSARRATSTSRWCAARRPACATSAALDQHAARRAAGGRQRGRRADGRPTAMDRSSGASRSSPWRRSRPAAC